MHIYLNPPRTFWAIAGTDIRLTRSQAFYEVTDDEFNSLDEEQKEILRLAKETNVITEINKEFIPKNQGMAGVDYIITLPATEIQKKYVSKMRMAKDVKSLNALLQKEKESSSPRSSVIQMIKFALDSLAFDTGGDYYNEIEEIEEEVIVFQPKVPEVAQPNKKPARKKSAKLTESNQ